MHVVWITVASHGRYSDATQNNRFAWERRGERACGQRL